MWVRMVSSLRGDGGGVAVLLETCRDNGALEVIVYVNYNRLESSSKVEIEGCTKGRGALWSEAQNFERGDLTDYQFWT